MGACMRVCVCVYVCVPVCVCVCVWLRVYKIRKVHAMCYPTPALNSATRSMGCAVAKRTYIYLLMPALLFLYSAHRHKRVCCMQCGVCWQSL